MLTTIGLILKEQQERYQQTKVATRSRMAVPLSQRMPAPDLGPQPRFGLIGGSGVKVSGKESPEHKIHRLLIAT